MSSIPTFRGKISLLRLNVWSRFNTKLFRDNFFIKLYDLKTLWNAFDVVKLIVNPDRNCLLFSEKMEN